MGTCAFHIEYITANFSLEVESLSIKTVTIAFYKDVALMYNNKVLIIYVKYWFW